MRILQISLLAAALAVTSIAQDVAPIRKRVVAPDTSPVTVAEAHAVFRKAESLIRPLLKLPAGEVIPVSASAELLDREKLVDLIAKLREVARPELKITPYPAVYDKARLTIKGPVAESLVRDGFIADVCPLATGKQPLSPRVVGDTVGYFMARVCDLGHVPSHLWSPYLQNEMKMP